MTARRHNPAALGIIFALVLACGACGQSEEGGDGGEESAQVEPGLQLLERREPRRLQPEVRVRLAPVVRARVGSRSELSGVVSAFRKATVAAEVAGRVMQRRVETGDAIEVDQVLVQLDGTRSELAYQRARAQLRSRSVDLEESESEAARAETLIANNAISRTRYDAVGFTRDRAETAVAEARAAVSTARQQVRDATIRAPFAGTVEAVNVQVGDYLAPGTPVATVVDFSRARVRAGVTAAEASMLAPDTAVSLGFDGIGGELEGRIRSVARVADPGSGTFAVEMWLDGSNSRLREGMVGRVHLLLPAEEERAAVPHAALMRRGGRIMLYVVDPAEDEPMAELREVRIGRRNDQLVEVLAGVEFGEQVVVDGLFALRDGTPVSIDSTAVAKTSAREG